ncbi:S8 family serine peptidase [Lentzea sp. NPDC058450]|uniref:S8 family serine peptidase n=1 Tax=Lentzea sp. NPDC058450 TaxID=3346505 RepID=UPI003657EBBA
MVVRSPSSPSPEADDVPLPEWPQWLLDKHGAKVLRPTEAARAPGSPRPVATVYRSDVLLVPVSVLEQGATRGQVDDELRRVGLTIRQGEDLPGVDLPPEFDALDEETRQLVPVPIVLSARPDETESDSENAVAVVDAWTAQEQIRAGVAAGRIGGRGVGAIAVEHLFSGADYGGVPTWVPHDLRDGEAAAPYPMIPVAFSGAPPVRPQLAAGHRRVVIAVPDTGINQHPWFGITAKTLSGNGFVHGYAASAAAIAQQAGKLSGLTPTQVLQDFWESPLYANALSEELGRATGHFTFIAGLIHQVAPAADVLALRVLHTDNVAYEADLLLALWLLVARVTAAQAAPAGDERRRETVDVVSFSLGAYLDRASAKEGHLRAVLTRLTDLGVLLVAAAGNDRTTRPFHPAAFAAELTSEQAGPKVMGVGALNPDETEAWFSNAGPNVTVYATGANVLSTFPTVAKGSRGSNSAVASGERRTADPDQFSSGFAIASGTSYATAEFAAAVARGLGDSIPLNEKSPLDRMRKRAARQIKKYQGS